MKLDDSMLIGRLLRNFFIEYLCSQKRLSPQTIASYRDSFRLLLKFVLEKYGIPPVKQRITDLSATVIIAFLEYLEQTRENSARSRNQRLAAIRSFFRFVALREPAAVSHCSAVLAIPSKRTDKKLVRALTREEMDAILTGVRLDEKNGRRDHALLLTLYNTGARVSEITALLQSQIRFGTSSVIHLEGKGRKERAVPLWSKSARVLKAWLEELSTSQMSYVFPSASGHKLTRNGVNYILQQAIKRASIACPSLLQKRITPHSIRHTTGTHLLQAGTDISVIALWLGHATIETTHIYVEADLASKERALSQLAPAGNEPNRFKATDEVLSFLERL